MKDLGKAIGKLNKKQRDKIFGQGTKFMSLEVMYPKTVNVIPYGLSMLYFHGVKEYNDKGDVIGDDRSGNKTFWNDKTNKSKCTKDIYYL